jgi:hypothetical protein
MRRVCGILIMALFFTTIAAAEGTVRIVNVAEGLNLRDAPSMDGKILALVPFNAEVKALEETGDTVAIQGASGKWTRVEWNGKRGWVFGGFFLPPKPAVTSAVWKPIAIYYGGNADLVVTLADLPSGGVDADIEIWVVAPGGKDVKMATQRVRIGETPCTKKIDIDFDTSALPPESQWDPEFYAVIVIPGHSIRYQSDRLLAALAWE